jgi:hypothetical protein
MEGRGTADEPPSERPSSARFDSGRMGRDSSGVESTLPAFRNPAHYLVALTADPSPVGHGRADPRRSVP